MRVKDPEKRRPLIVEAALECIRDRGIANTRVADIAQRAGTSPALVVYHFKGLDAVIEAALDLAEETFYAALDQVENDQTNATDRLRALAALSLDEAARDRNWSTWLEVWSEARRNPDFRSLRAKLNERWLGAIRGCLLLGQREGVFGPCDVNREAMKLAMLMDGMAVSLLMEDKLVTSEQLTALWLETAAVDLGCESLTA